MFGFGDEPEAKYFYGHALSEAGVIAATDLERFVSRWRGEPGEGPPRLAPLLFD